MQYEKTGTLVKLLPKIAQNLIIRELIGRVSIYPFEQFSLSQLVNEVKPRPPTLIMIENYDHNVPQLTSSIFEFSVSIYCCEKNIKTQLQIQVLRIKCKNKLLGKHSSIMILI